MQADLESLVRPREIAVSRNSRIAIQGREDSESQFLYVNLGDQFMKRQSCFEIIEYVVCTILVFGTFVCLTTPAIGVDYSIGSNFSDSTFAQSLFIPPDTMGAVGPSDVAILINGRFAVYDRNGNQQVNTSLDQFWINAGVNPTSFSFDPRIIYDAHSDRWFATAVDNGGNANNLLVGVSQTNDPKGAWTGFAVDSDADNSHWADFPMMGLNQDAVVISANMFDAPGGAVNSANVSFLVVPKADLTQAVPTVANSTLFENINPNTTGFAPQPILDYDNGNLALPILSSFNKPAGSLKVSSIGGTASSPTLDTAGGFIGVTGRSSAPNIDQPGPKADVSAGDSRFSGNVVMQHIPGRTNPSIWGVHTVDIGGRAALEWYEIDSVNDNLLQSGTITDSSLAYNYPSIAVNDLGHAVIGFSGGDPNTFMSTYVAVGETIGGVTSFDPVEQTKAGVADYQRLDGNNRNRWGDYSSTVVDPSDELSFWTFQLFANATDSWQVQATQINIVPEPATVTFTILSGLLCGVTRRRG